MSEVEPGDDILALAAAIDGVIDGHPLSDVLNALSHITAMCVLQGADTMDEAKAVAQQVTDVIRQTVADNPDSLGAPTECECCRQKGPTLQ